MSDDNVLAEIQREVKTFGDNTKELKASMEKDLADVRKIAEDAGKNATSPELTKQIDAFTLSISEKHGAIDTLMKAQQDQVDAIETAMKRSPTGDTGENADHTKAALEFFDAKAAATGNLAWRTRADAASADIAGYKSWEENFETYLRASDDRDVDAKALSVGANPNGGYLVPTARSARIVTRIHEVNPVRQLATVETVGTDSLEIPIDIDEASAGWVGEMQSRPETGTPDIGVQKIAVFEIYAKPKATQKFLEDASINVEAWLAAKTGEKMGRIEAAAFINGTGVNQPRGILSYAAGSTGTRGTILQHDSGASGLITADAVTAMPFQIKGAYLANAVWLMKRSTVQAVMLLKDSQGQYMWRPGLAAGQPSTLGGYAVQQADDMPVVAAGTLPIAFGDFRRGYTVVDRLGITVLRDPYSAKPFVEFYSRKRVGGDVVDFEAYALMKIAS